MEKGREMDFIREFTVWRIRKMSFWPRQEM